MFESRCDERGGSMGEKKWRVFEVILKCLDVYFKFVEIGRTKAACEGFYVQESDVSSSSRAWSAGLDFVIHVGFP